MRRIVTNVLMGFGLLLSLFTLFSMLGSLHWILDVFSHYHLQYAIGLLLALTGLLLLGHVRIYLLAPLAALLINLSLVAPFFWPPATQAAWAAGEPSLSVMVMNISTSTAGYDQVIELIRQRQPDVVFMSEVREDLVVRLEAELADSHPYLHAAPSRMTMGNALLSRYPFTNAETVTMDEAGSRRRRYLRAELEWQGQVILLAGIHPLPPFNGDWAAGRNREIAQMGQLAREATQPFLLLGDLNASPWSHPMRQLMESTELRYALQGHGVWPTWRLAGPLLGAPLDYILVSPQWQVKSYLEGGDIGSDHLPVQADLLLTPGSEAE